MTETVAEAEAEIRQIIAENNVVMFSMDGCPYCDAALKALKEAGIEVVVIEATDPQLTALEQITSQGSVPNIWVRGKFVGGCNDGPESWMGVKKLLRNGELQKMLSA